MTESIEQAAAYRSSPLSVVILTLNEEHNIADCIRALSFADDIVIVDSFSTDKTVEIARSFPGFSFCVWMGNVGGIDDE